MKYKTILFISIFLASVLFPLRALAQVTIGMDTSPVSGALLQLRNNADGTADKGLVLPRVYLTDLKSLIDINPGNPNRPEPLTHTGLLVYNPRLVEKGMPVYTKSTVCPGVYIWDGTEWISLTQSQPEYFVDVRTKADGNKEIIEYPIRQFGEAGTWMLQNLRATTYADNLGINKATEDLVPFQGSVSTSKRYRYPGPDPNILDENKNPEYGLLYNWYAATNNKMSTINEGEGDIVNGSPNADANNIEQIGVQGVCPEGWHLPSDKEWNDLERVVSNEQTGLYTIDNYKPDAWDSGSVKWEFVNDGLNYRNNINGHGISLLNAYQIVTKLVPKGKSKGLCDGGGFNAYVVGISNATGTTVAFTYGVSTIFASSSSVSSTHSWVRSLLLSNVTPNKNKGVVRFTITRDSLLSVRCKRNN